MLANERLIVALDTTNLQLARDIALELAGVVAFFKVGLELVSSAGMDQITLALPGVRLFVDLKLPNDIPETIRRTCQSLADYGAEFISIGTGASDATIEAALKGVSGSETKLLYVTSLSSENIFYSEMEMMANSLHGAVASGGNIPHVRAVHPGKIIVAPGIRWGDHPYDDHVRVLRPYEAICAGADYIVVGRPIRRAKNRLEVALQVTASIQLALEGMATDRRLS